ncbi:MAG: LytTR family DNA-binding domain-containing protein [Acidobacteriota bacterium]
MTDPRRILIVDDEPLARQRIARYLAQRRLPLVIEEAESGLRAVELIAEFRPDIIFLDVEMPGLSGLEVLQQFEERPFQVVFETAYDEFAIRAFEEHACDYLLKPFTEARFNHALDRALKQSADHARLRALEATLAEREGHLSRVIVKHGGRMRIVEAREITCFVSRDHYTCVYFGGGREGLADLSINFLSERLDPRAFIRLHRNSIARISAIKAVSSREDEMTVELEGGIALAVSRSRRATVRKLMKSLH